MQRAANLNALAGVDTPVRPQPEARRLRQELRHAVETGGFALQFQPRRSLLDGALVGAEAQLRWPRRRGAVPAGGVMALLELYGLALPMVDWALRAACRAASSWADGLVSVTVPGWALHDGSLLTCTGGALAESGLSPHRLELALQEAALAQDTDNGLLALAALRDLGVGIALEGFGGEAAGLLPVRDMPLTVVKLDRALARDLPDCRIEQAMAAAIIPFAAALDIAVVATGVETEAQREFLRQMGCEAAQGSLLGRPVADLSLQDAA